mmetsp:Transcript_12478/g.28929  ORF Transcript_12478/g.28929 Transcript_12478/m.28929 type:complete len:119 (+) Transcript_12478:911-1267(+)
MLRTFTCFVLTDTRSWVVAVSGIGESRFVFVVVVVVVLPFFVLYVPDIPSCHVVLWTTGREYADEYSPHGDCPEMLWDFIVQNRKEKRGDNLLRTTDRQRKKKIWSLFGFLSRFPQSA